MSNALPLKQLLAAGQSTVLGRVDEHFQFHHTGTFHHGPTERVDQIDGTGQSPAGGNEIINDQDAVALLDLIPLDRHPGPIAVFRLVRLRLDRVGHLPLLPHHNEGLFQGKGNGWTEDETTRVQAGDGIDANLGIAMGEYIDNLLEYVGLGKEATNVVEARVCP